MLVAIPALYLAYESTTQSQPQPQLQATYFPQKFCFAGSQNSTAVAYALADGAKCFRSDVYLNQSDSGLISNVSNNGGEYLGILDYATVGAQPSPRGCVSGCNWTLSTWNASVANAILNYPEIKTWEIYNEPLFPNFMSGYDNGSALNYFNMMASASQAIKGRNPNATVVCFGGAELFPLSTLQIEYGFYKQVWNYGASRYCDAISLHLYTLPYYDLGQRAYSNATVMQTLAFTLNLYENLTGKPVWITETGMPSNIWYLSLNDSEQRQASFLKQDLTFLASYPFVARIYWYALMNSGGPDFGLLNSSTLSPKPAWSTFLYFVKNSTS